MVELDAVDKVHTYWACTVIGTDTLVVLVDSKPITDEQIAQVMVPIHDDMNRIWCIVSSAFGGGGISIMVACVGVSLGSS